MLVFLCRVYEDLDNAQARHLYRLGQSISYLHQHSDKTVNVSQLSRMAHLSQRQFFRVFRKATEQTPIQYQQMIQINHAKELLEKTDLSMTEIAQRCGFDDSNYFSRIFHKKTGLTPRDYRSTVQ